jgi:hypothetical protein
MMAQALGSTDTDKVRYSGKTGSEPRAVKVTRMPKADSACMWGVWR